MKRFALGLAAILVSTVAAHADDLFAVAYGNTVTQTYNGQATVIYVNPDKTWEQHRSDGSVMKGTYSWKDDHTACFTLVDPAPKDPTKATNCNGIEGNHKVGDTWTETLPNNQGTITMSITPGRS
jgi:hypothetical protein